MKVRNTLSVIAGVIASVIIIFIGEAIAHNLFPLPADISTPEALKKFIAAVPASFHLYILANYAVGCLIGGTIAAWIAEDKKMTKAITLGGLFMGIGLFTLVSVGHPAWVIIVSLFAFLPFAYFGGLIGIKLSKKN
ncbi:MAG: hypothetical protein ACXVPU_10250 [Bacteroidia bacterium]